MVKPVIKLTNELETCSVIDELNDRYPDSIISSVVGLENEIMISFSDTKLFFEFILLSKSGKKVYEEMIDTGEMWNLWEDGTIGKFSAIYPHPDHLKFDKWWNYLGYGKTKLKLSYYPTHGGLISTPEKRDVNIQDISCYIYRGSRRLEFTNVQLISFIHRLGQLGLKEYLSPKTTLFKDNANLKRTRFDRDMSIDRFLCKLNNNEVQRLIEENHQEGEALPPRFTIVLDDVNRENMLGWTRLSLLDNEKLNELGVSRQSNLLINSQFGKFHPRNYNIDKGVSRALYIKEIPNIIYLSIYNPIKNSSKWIIINTRGIFPLPIYLKGGDDPNATYELNYKSLMDQSEVIKISPSMSLEEVRDLLQKPELKASYSDFVNTLNSLLGLELTFPTFPYI